jgi:hypothetical protein
LNETVDSILITNEWGFIVLRSSEKVDVFSVNGVFLAALEIRILSWSSFTAFDGIDYIAFAAESGGVGIFEAFCPDRIDIFHRCTDVLELFYQPERARLVIVRRSGIVQIIPHAIT